MDTINTFFPIDVSSKFAICGMPIRMDTYKNCTFGCTYCFSNNREIAGYNKTNIEIADYNSLDKYLYNTFNKELLKKDFLKNLILSGITWHCGGMSDPFQPCEKIYKATENTVNITNKYNISILFSTKTDNLYGGNYNPNLHSFQLSISNCNNDKRLEPNVPDINKRLELFKYLKKNGFKVGIRIQPFIPNITTLDIVKMFEGADHFTLEGIKLVPQNKLHKELIFDITKIGNDNYTQMGLLNLRPEVRLKFYEPFINYFEENNISYSLADNDLHNRGNNYCCCGDKLIKKSSNFNNTFLCHKYNTSKYTKEQLDNELKESGISNCNCNQLFTSNRQEGCKTVQEFFDKRYNRDSSPFSPKFLYDNQGHADLFGFTPEFDFEYY